MVLLRWFCVLLIIPYLSAFANKPRQIILDTDWWTDVDDAACVRLLVKAHQSGQIRFVGICIDAVRETSIPSLRAFLAYEGCTDIPIGMDMYATDFNGKPCYHELLMEYGERLANTFDVNKTKKCNEQDVQDCVAWYRRMLTKVRGKVDILAVGYPNALARLLQSPADSYNRLSGRDLVRKKVRHLWMMAGNYPQGKENNFTRTKRTRESGALLCREWPTEITFLGFDVGVDVLSGALLKKDDLLHQVICKLKPQGRRSSWDPLTAWMAISGKVGAVGFGCVKGTNSVNSKTGYNFFVENAKGKHAYVTRLHETSWYEAKLDSMLSLQDHRK